MHEWLFCWARKIQWIKTSPWEYFPLTFARAGGPAILIDVLSYTMNVTAAFIVWAWKEPPLSEGTIKLIWHWRVFVWHFSPIQLFCSVYASICQALIIKLKKPYQSPAPYIGTNCFSSFSSCNTEDFAENGLEIRGFGRTFIGTTSVGGGGESEGNSCSHTISTPVILYIYTYKKLNG